MDPVIKEWESPYACFANNPIWFVDPSGADTISYNSPGKKDDVVDMGDGTFIKQDADDVVVLAQKIQTNNLQQKIEIDNTYVKPSIDPLKSKMRPYYDTNVDKNTGTESGGKKWGNGSGKDYAHAGNDKPIVSRAGELGQQAGWGASPYSPPGAWQGWESSKKHLITKTDDKEVKAKVGDLVTTTLYSSRDHGKAPVFKVIGKNEKDGIDSIEYTGKYVPWDSLREYDIKTLSAPKTYRIK